MLQIFSTISCIIDCLLILIIIQYLADDRFYMKKPLLTILIAVCMGIFTGFVDSYFSGSILAFPVQVLFSLSVYLLSIKGDIIRKLGRYLLAILCFLTVKVLASFVMMIFMTDEVVITIINTQFFIVSSIINLAVIILLYYFSNKKKILIQFSKIEWFLLLTLLIFALALLKSYIMFLDMEINNIEILSDNSPEIVRVAINYSVLYFAVFLYLFLLTSLVTGKITSHFRKARKLTQEHMLQQLEYFKVYRTTQDETRRYKHDMKNHFLYLNALSHDNKIEEMKEYIASLSDHWENLTQLVSTGNDVVDTIIYGKNFLFEQNHISLSVEGMFVTDLKIDPIDLCTIFTNAIDNAVESNIKCPDDENRYLNIHIKVSRNNYLVSFMNPLNTKLHIHNNHIETDKEEDYHGYGLKNIEHSLAKYGGSYQIKTTQDRTFILELIIQNG